jgi:hypothetical protein
MKHEDCNGYDDKLAGSIGLSLMHFHGHLGWNKGTLFLLPSSPQITHQ